jgi:hypothetical protein
MMSELRIHQLTFIGDSMRVAFSDEREVVVDVSAFPRLRKASSAQREQWQLIGRGLGVHWEELDEDLSVENILTAYSRAKDADYANLAS